MDFHLFPYSEIRIKQCFMKNFNSREFHVNIFHSAFHFIYNGSSSFIFYFQFCLYIIDVRWNQLKNIKNLQLINIFIYYSD